MRVCFLDFFVFGITGFYANVLATGRRTLFCSGRLRKSLILALEGGVAAHQGTGGERGYHESWILEGGQEGGLGGWMGRELILLPTSFTLNSDKENEPLGIFCYFIPLKEIRDFV